MSTFSVLLQENHPGDPSTWTEGADQPKVLASGLSYENAHSMAKAVKEEILDHEPDCDRCEIDEIDGEVVCGPDCCKGDSDYVYVEEEADEAFLKRAKAM